MIGLLDINLSGWFADFWTVYGGMVTPIMITMIGALITWIAVKIKSDAKITKARTEAQINALKEVANKETDTRLIEEQNAKIEQNNKTICLLADMFNIVFQNSDLSNDVKSNIGALTNKIKYGTEEDLVKELQQQNTLLAEQVKALTDEISSNVVNETTTEQTKRNRR